MSLSWTDDLDELLAAIAQHRSDTQRLASHLKARWRLEKEQLVYALARRLQARYSPMRQSPEPWQRIDLSKVEEPPLLVGDIRQRRQYRLKTNAPETVALDLAAALPGQVLLVGFRVDVLATRWRQRGETQGLLIVEAKSFSPQRIAFTRIQLP